MKVVLLALLSCLLASPGLAAADPPQEAAGSPYMVEMSDGVRLATLVFLPGPVESGPWPVILERTPYNRKTAAVKKLFEFDKKGYAVVAQNVRGTTDSEGESIASGTDGWGGPGFRDGVDSVSWILKQPWCNGRIGVAGFSASGITAHFLIAAAPRGLVCAYINAAPDNLYEWYYPNGCERTAIRPGGERTAAEIAKHPTYDAFWKSRNARERQHLSNVPVYILGGWFDSFERSSAAFFRGQHNNGLYPSNGNCKLHLYPTAHAAPPGQLEFPLAPGVSPEKEIGSMFEWFEYWLKGVDNGILDKPAVALFLMKDKDVAESDGNRYIYAENWPPATKPLNLYLREGRKLSLEPPSEAGASSAYTYDPDNPTPKPGGRNVFPPSGPHDQREIEARKDVIAFETEPLSGDVTVIGPVTATLYASSDARDTDFSVRLCDVYPDGRSMLMCDGMVRARYRDSNVKTKLMKPGKVYRFTIDLWDTCLTFSKGHRIRVDIASSDAPRFKPNPNGKMGRFPISDLHGGVGRTAGNGEAPQFFRKSTKKIVALNTIFHDAAYPSHITLPLWNAEGRKPLSQGLSVK